MCPKRKQNRFPKPAATPTTGDMRDLSLIKRPIPANPSLLSRQFVLAEPTDTVLVLQRVTTNEVGIYDAVLTNWAGATTSAPVRLTLINLSASAPQPPVLQVNGVGDYRGDYQNTLATNNGSFWTNLSLSLVTQREVTGLEAGSQQARFYRVLPQ